VWEKNVNTMLDAITDFWKPLKRNNQQAKPKLSDLAVDSEVVFGFVPQVLLSGRRLRVSAVNSYQFGTETLTSFVLSQDGDSDVSIIVADAQGEQYLAISRRISVGDRIKLFEDNAIEQILEKTEVTRLTCRDNIPEFKSWLVAGYKREIQSMSGKLFKADMRKLNSGTDVQGESFQYALLVSDTNEHAIEIEKYADGRVELFATVYRRTSDIAELTPLTDDIARPDVKLVSNADVKPEVAPETVQEAKKEEAKIEVKIEANPEVKSEVTAAPAPVKAPEAEAKAESVARNDNEVKAAEAPAAVVVAEKEAPKEVAKEVPAPSVAPAPVLSSTAQAVPLVKLEATALPQFTAATPLEPVLPKPAPKPVLMQPAIIPATTSPVEEKTTMLTTPTLTTVSAQENNAVIKNTVITQDNESIACELHVANQIIEEAIRQEMRLSDVVRRIIALPVADKQEVHIPVTLSDDDYSLLAIRYAIPATDRNAIKQRIIDDLNEFSGNKKPLIKAA
jgi:hypothetical protein